MNLLDFLEIIIIIVRSNQYNFLFIQILKIVFMIREKFVIIAMFIILYVELCFKYVFIIFNIIIKVLVLNCL